MTDSLKEWYDEVGKHKLLSMSMIYDQAKLLAEKMNLATIDKPRAFVDGFMRHGNIRISDTPYAKARFHIHRIQSIGFVFVEDVLRDFSSTMNLKMLKRFITNN